MESWNSQFPIHTWTFLAIISIASQLFPCLFWISLWLRMGVYNTLASKSLCKIAQASKNSDSNAQHFLSDLLTHPWFHSMLFALPSYQFPYIIMNRCLTFNGMGSPSRVWNGPKGLVFFFSSLSFDTHLHTNQNTHRCLMILSKE
jgi:hypothetical protein